MGFSVAVKNYRYLSVEGVGWLFAQVYIAQTAVGSHKAHRFDKQRELVLHMWEGILPIWIFTLFDFCCL